MSKLIRTKEGAFFQETPQGLTAINDPRTLTALYQGQIPYENLATTEGQTFSSGVASPNLVPQPTGGVSDTSGSAQLASAGQNTSNPITKFNLAILDMLKKAQSGELVAQQNKDELRRSAYQSGMEQFTGTDAIMSPEAKMSALNRNVEMYQPSVEAATLRIKQLGDVVDLMKTTYGEDFSNLLPATEEDAQTFRMALRAGMSLPADIIKKYAKYFTIDDYAAWAEQNRKGTTETIKAPVSSTGANYNTRLSSEISNLYAGKYGTEGAREKVLNILKGEFPTVDVAKDVYNRIPNGYEKNIKPEGRMTASTIDQQTMTDLMEDIKGGATLNQLYSAYPELSPSLIQSIYYNQ